MKKRAFAAVLWFYVGWYGGAMLAEFLGVSPLLGPMIGTAAAAAVRRGPMGHHLAGRLSGSWAAALEKQRLT